MVFHYYCFARSEFLLYLATLLISFSMFLEYILDVTRSGENPVESSLGRTTWVGHRY